MTEIEPNKYQEWILETIDSLRLRKARPDLERICRMVRRRYGSDPDRTRDELEKLIQSHTVLKVSYKGSVSYRNAAKVLRRNRKNTELVASSGASSKQEHLNNSGDSAQSFTELDPQEASLGPSEPETPLNSVHNSGCNRESSCCVASEQPGPSALSTGFTQQQEGCRQPSHVGHTHHVSSAPRGEVEPHGVNFKNNKTCILPMTLSIKPKLCTGNSAHSDRRLASVSNLSAASAGNMKTLRLTGILGYLGHHERFPCEEKLGRTKVKVVADSNVARARLLGTRCGNLTLGAAAALGPSDQGKQLQESDPTQTAGQDERRQGAGEHVDEDIPQSCDKLSEPHVTMTTDPEAEDAIPRQSCGEQEIDGASCLLTPTASPTDSGLDEPECLTGGPLSPIDWSVSDVVSYFIAEGFPEQAAAFRSQEIDGKSLLLMQRNDVLTGLSIKLGPALKIYEHHVKALQKTHFEEDEL